MVGVDRDVAPAEDALALDADVELEEVLELPAPRLVAREEADGDAVAAAVGELEVDARPEERVRQLQEHPGAVARARVGARGAAVLEVLDRLQSLLDDLVRRHVVQARDERHAARIVLVAGVVEAFSLWQGGLGAHMGVPPTAVRGT